MSLLRLHQAVIGQGGGGGGALNAEILADNPVWYTRCNETSGTVANDYGSAATNGTYNGTPTFSQPAIYAGGPNCVLLDGSGSDSISIPSSVLTSTTALTLELVHRPTNVSGIQQLITRDDGSGGTRVWQFRRNGTQLELIKIVGGTQSVSFNNFFTLNTAVHVMATITSGGAVTLYRNGSSVATGSFAAGANYGTASLDIYVNRLVPGGTDVGNGDYSEIAIYAAALSGARAAAHASAAGF